MEVTEFPDARDRIWSTALRVAFTRYGHEFTTADVVAEVDDRSHTHDRPIRRTLDAMAHLGWLEKKRDDQAVTWQLRDQPPWADASDRG